MTFREIHKLTREESLKMLIEVLGAIRSGNVSLKEIKTENTHHHKNSFSNSQLHKLGSTWDTTVEDAKATLKNEIEEYHKYIKGCTEYEALLLEALRNN